MGVPAITIRDTTERPETVECGSNILAGVDPSLLVRLLTTRCADRGWWKVPTEYQATHVAATVVNVVLGYNALLRTAGAANAGGPRTASGLPGKGAGVLASAG